MQWILERERIRRAKESGEPKPWTDDPVFRRVYFTNVHREDDRVTRWVRENYTPEYFGEYYEPAIVAARLFNRPSTLDFLKQRLFPIDKERLGAELRKWRDWNPTIWGNAYVITTNGVKMDKIDYGLDLIERASQKLPFPGWEHLCKNYYHWIKQIHGLGSFLSAQVVADLKNTKGHPLYDCEDWRTFSAPGPGSLRGLSWYFQDNITPTMYEDAIQKVRDDLGDAWQLHSEGILTRMCMQDLQNCLCEFDKYCRVLTGSGRSKRRYDG